MLKETSLPLILKRIDCVKELSNHPGLVPDEDQTLVDFFKVHAEFCRELGIPANTEDIINYFAAEYWYAREVFGDQISYQRDRIREVAPRLRDHRAFLNKYVCFLDYCSRPPHYWKLSDTLQYLGINNLFGLAIAGNFYTSGQGEGFIGTRGIAVNFSPLLPIRIKTLARASDYPIITRNGGQVDLEQRDDMTLVLSYLNPQFHN